MKESNWKNCGYVYIITLKHIMLKKRNEKLSDKKQSFLLTGMWTALI